jgi:hypothetical protein
MVVGICYKDSKKAHSSWKKSTDRGPQSTEKILNEKCCWLLAIDFDKQGL